MPIHQVMQKYSYKVIDLTCSTDSYLFIQTQMFSISTIKIFY